jgi:hypothetical protein
MYFIAAGAAQAARISGTLKSPPHRSAIDSVKGYKMTWFGDSVNIVGAVWLIATYGIAAVLLWVSRESSRKLKSPSLTES